MTQVENMVAPNLEIAGRQLRDLTDEDRRMALRQAYNSLQNVFFYLELKGIEQTLLRPPRGLFNMESEQFLRETDRRFFSP